VEVSSWGGRVVVGLSVGSEARSGDGRDNWESK